MNEKLRVYLVDPKVIFILLIIQSRSLNTKIQTGQIAAKDIYNQQMKVTFTVKIPSELRQVIHVLKHFQSHPKGRKPVTGLHHGQA